MGDCNSSGKQQDTQDRIAKMSQGVNVLPFSSVTASLLVPAENMRTNGLYQLNGLGIESRGIRISEATNPVISFLEHAGWESGGWAELSVQNPLTWLS